MGHNLYSISLFIFLFISLYLSLVALKACLEIRGRLGIELKIRTFPRPSNH